MILLRQIGVGHREPLVQLTWTGPLLYLFSPSTATVIVTWLWCGMGEDGALWRCVLLVVVVFCLWILRFLLFRPEERSLITVKTKQDIWARERDHRLNRIDFVVQSSDSWNYWIFKKFLNFITWLFSGCHFIFCIFVLFMLLVVFWLLIFNESIMYWHICYATMYIWKCINYHILEYTSVTCHFIVGTWIEILNFFTYTFLAPPTSSFVIHVCETLIQQL